MLVCRCDDEVRSSRLLCCLDEFVGRRCHSSLAVSECFRSVDRDLLTSGWQEASFINDTTTIFVYALLSRCVDDYGQLSADELRTLVYVCLYMSYTYIGPEISYPLRPFIRDCCNVDQTTAATDNPYHDEEEDSDDDDDVDDEDVVIVHDCSTSHSLNSTSVDSDDQLMDDCRRRFWTCCMFLVEHCSRLMLRLNSDSELYARIYRQLTTYSPTSVSREP